MGDVGAGKKRALVTGHLGYVGVVLAPLLQREGWDVTGLDIGLYDHCDYGGAPESIPALSKDIRDVSAGDLVGFDCVFHLAGLSNDPLGDIDPVLTDEINFRATVHLAEAARDAGVSRFVFSSSCSNYGASDGGWLSESAQLNPVTPYALSKMRSEAALGLLATESFSPVILRSGTAYGYSPRIRFDLVVNNLTAWAVATGQVRMKSDGTAWRPLVHVEDMARAFALVGRADSQAVHAQAFNVGVNEDCMQVRKIAEMVENTVPGSTVAFAAGCDSDIRTYKVDCAKIAALGFRPKWSVERGISELCRVFTANGVAVEDFEGTRFQRVAHVRNLMQQGLFDTRLRRESLCPV